MLVLTRKVREQIQIGDEIKVTILRVTGQSVRIGIEAPRTVRVMRTELPLAEQEPAGEVLSVTAKIDATGVGTGVGTGDGPSPLARLVRRVLATRPAGEVAMADPSHAARHEAEADGSTDESESDSCVIDLSWVDPSDLESAVREASAEDFGVQLGGAEDEDELAVAVGGGASGFPSLEADLARPERPRSLRPAGLSPVRTPGRITAGSVRSLVRSRR